MDYTNTARATLLGFCGLMACLDEPEQVVENSDVPGVYNIVDVNDNSNLELRADGTFRTIEIGCDFEGSSSGLWAVDGDDIILTAAGEGEQSWADGVCPTACFSWPYIGPEGEGLSAAVEEVRLVEQPDGSRTAVFYDLIQDWEIDDQKVAAGGVCITCGVGPAPCDDPFSHDPYAGE